MSKIETPTSEEQVAEIVAKTRADKKTLRIEGGGTRSGLGPPLKTDVTLSLKKLSGINLYEPGALTLVTKSGTTLKEIEKALTPEGQRLAFEPMDHRPLFGTKGEPTIGAAVAGNISGPRRIQAGACRDALIGVRFVNGMGEIVKNGGRVMKNVTGLDLVKLMAGSYGTLGVITEVAFKLLPAQERQATISVEGLSTAEAVTIMSGALGSPFEITGAAYVPKTDNISITLLRVEGFSSQVDYRIKSLSETICAPHNVKIIEGAEHDALWRSIRDVELFKGGDNPVWRISVKPGDAPEIEKELSDKTGAKMLFDWGGGLIWASMGDGEAHSEAVRHIIGRKGGHATLVRASEKIRSEIPVFQPEQPGIARLSASIRKKFDPDGVLNPGFMAKQR